MFGGLILCRPPVSGVFRNDILQRFLHQFFLFREGDIICDRAGFDVHVCLLVGPVVEQFLLPRPDVRFFESAEAEREARESFTEAPFLLALGLPREFGVNRCAIGGEEFWRG